MQRTDRLFEIINILRASNRPITAAQIADQLEVTPRTIYRHIATLQSLRVPIEGEAGVGYVMRSGYDLPPLNFDIEEREAILVGLAMLKRTGDSKLQSAASRVMNKLHDKDIPENSLRASDWGIPEAQGTILSKLRCAIRDEQKIEICYTSLDETHSERIVWPLVLTYHVEVGVLSGWCELREDFRNFRVDRIATINSLEAFFVGEAVKLREQLELK